MKVEERIISDSGKLEIIMNFTGGPGCYITINSIASVEKSKIHLPMHDDTSTVEELISMLRKSIELRNKKLIK